MSARGAADKSWLVHLLYLRGEHAACEAVIEEQLHAHRALCEHPLVVKGLLRRQQPEAALRKCVARKLRVDVQYNGRSGDAHVAHAAHSDERGRNARCGGKRGGEGRNG